MLNFSTEDVTARLGELVATRRHEYGLTQLALAELAGVSERSVRALEAGKSTARLDTALPVLNVLGIAFLPGLESR